MASISGRVGDLGSYLREQREHARLSLRQLATLAGVSNPYLSQVERGLRKPSAEVLQQIAHGLRISAEALYVRAGILEEEQNRPGVDEAVNADPELTDRQRRVLLDIYNAFRTENARTSVEPEPTAPVRRRSGRSEQTAAASIMTATAGRRPSRRRPSPTEAVATAVAAARTDETSADAVPVEAVPAEKAPAEPAQAESAPVGTAQGAAVTEASAPRRTRPPRKATSGRSKRTAPADTPADTPAEPGA